MRPGYQPAHFFSPERAKGSLRSQAALGERGQALKHYQALVEMLNAELGTAPAPETRALYKSLRCSGEDV